MTHNIAMRDDDSDPLPSSDQLPSWDELSPSEQTDLSLSPITLGLIVLLVLILFWA